jgi:hypothetical protein
MAGKNTLFSPESEYFFGGAPGDIVFEKTNTLRHVQCLYVKDERKIFQMGRIGFSTAAILKQAHFIVAIPSPVIL